MSDTTKAVTDYVRTWISDQNARGIAYSTLADMLKVSKTQVIHVSQGVRNVGPDLEANFAALFFKGSIDKLRAEALKPRASAATAAS